LIDEESRININSATAEVIARLPGLDLSLAEAITTSALRPFHIKQELLSVAGVNAETFDKFKDFITVHSSGRVNINTAPQEVLEALGLESYLAEAICEFRKGSDGEEATEDDGIFQTVAGITETLNAFRGLSEPQVAAITNLVTQDRLAIEGENFCLTAQAYLLDRPAVRYNIIIAKDKIEEWREY
jgi:DNA uptake protein ComE-like DNA-binding protein